jgi:hyperosmotically inducible protein
MIRLLIRVALVVILIVAGAALYLGYWAGNRGTAAQPSTSTSAHSPATPATGTSGKIDTEKARERGAEIGEKTAVAASKVEASLAEASISAKIMSKMALDDTVKARSIRVSTDHSVVTLSGTVGSAAERDRAVALARETSGVSRVVDQLTIAR